jgi:hypothetical protein
MPPPDAGTQPRDCAAIGDVVAAPNRIAVGPGHAFAASCAIDHRLSRGLR